MRFIRSIFLLLFIGCVLGCSNPKNQQALILYLGAEPSILNPLLAIDSASSSVNSYIYNGLLTVDDKMNLIPDLAESYSINDAGTVIRFKLRSNVRWHDGKPFTAADVMFTFDKIADLKTQTVRRSDYIIDNKPVEFVVINPYEIEVRSPRPFAPLLTHLTMGIIPKHIYEHEDINQSKYNRQPIGTGPFKLRAWESSQYVLLNRNEDYFGDKPKLKKILLKIIPDSNTALLAFERDEIYSSSIPPKEFPRFSSNPQYQSFRFYDMMYTYMGFNLKHEFFKLPQVRQAIAMAIDKDTLVNGVLRGYGKTAHLPMSPVAWSYPKQSFFYPYDVNAAKKLLQEQGFVLNPKTGALQKNGRDFRFKLITNKGNKDREKVAELIQHQLKTLGIDVSIQLMEWSSFISLLNAKKDPKEFDAVILGWGLGLDPDLFSVWHSSQYPHGFNFIGYKNLEVDALLSQGRQTMKRDERRIIYSKLYNIIAQDVPYVFLYYPESLLSFSSRVKGLSAVGPTGLLNPIENIYMNADD